jgi:hypothetical protein
MRTLPTLTVKGNAKDHAPIVAETEIVNADQWEVTRRCAGAYTATQELTATAERQFISAAKE